MLLNLLDHAVLLCDSVLRERESVRKRRRNQNSEKRDLLSRIDVELDRHHDAGIVMQLRLGDLGYSLEHIAQSSLNDGGCRA